MLCPCHLPLFAAVFAGSAIGSAITEYYALLFWGAALYFTVALFAGVRWLTHAGDQSRTEDKRGENNQIAFNARHGAAAPLAGDSLPPAPAASQLGHARYPGRRGPHPARSHP